MMCGELKVTLICWLSVSIVLLLQLSLVNQQ